MGILATLTSRPLIARRLLTELRGLRRAAERIADVLELQNQGSAREGGQSFRGYSRAKSDSGGDGSGVDYTDPQFLALASAREQELIPLLGRQPTAEEILRAVAGDIE